MKEEDIRLLLQEFQCGRLTEDAAVRRICDVPFENLGFANVDHHREMRQGIPEVVYAEGKTKEQLLAILQSLYAHGTGNLMATRASEEKYQFVRDGIPEMQYDSAARMIYLERAQVSRDTSRHILVVTAGTSDIPIAEEARRTAYLCGHEVRTCYDCGVAGIHRLLSHREDILQANVVIVVAGMEGALASVVGGLTDKPVIAVPTSIGYGASFHGLSALLSMLNSCASGVSVVNIDNGFGAGMLAGKINRMR